MNVMSVSCEFLVNFIDTTRHVVVGFVKEIATFLLEFKKLVSGSSGFFSSFVRFFFSFSQAGLDIFESACQLLYRADQRERTYFSTALVFGLSFSSSALILVTSASSSRPTSSDPSYSSTSKFASSAHVTHLLGLLIQFLEIRLDTKAIGHSSSLSPIIINVHPVVVLCLRISSNFLAIGLQGDVPQQGGPCPKNQIPMEYQSPPIDISCK